MSTLHEGDTGPEVTELQQLLVTRGYPVEVDGDFGPGTVAAVRAFQAQNLDQQGVPLVVDGDVGPLTAWSLRNPKPDVQLPGPVDFTTLPDEALGGSVVGRAALKVAIAEMADGAREIGGDNRGPFVKKYLEPAGAPEGSAWCAGFVSFCFLAAVGGDRAKLPVPYNAGARSLLAAYQAKGWAKKPESGYSPLPGDLAFWWRVRMDGWQGHVGIVHQVRDGFLYTIEGNKSPRVQGFSYVRSRMDKLLGFGSVG